MDGVSWRRERLELAGVAGGPSRSALSQHSYTLFTRYQPAGRFLPLQFIDGSWLLVLSSNVGRRARRTTALRTDCGQAGGRALPPM